MSLIDELLRGYLDEEGEDEPPSEPEPAGKAETSTALEIGTLEEPWCNESPTVRKTQPIPPEAFRSDFPRKT